MHHIMDLGNYVLYKVIFCGTLQVFSIYFVQVISC